jgi:dCMP deaminase
MNNWDNKFIALANLIKTWSKDRSTKVGSVIVGKNNEVISLGYNGFPRGYDDNLEENHLRPTKYFLTIHSEINSITLAARNGISLEGKTIYITLFPCSECAKAIIQSGITRVVCPKPDFNHIKYGESFKFSLAMLQSSNLQIDYTD